MYDVIINSRGKVQLMHDGYHAKCDELSLQDPKPTYVVIRGYRIESRQLQHPEIQRFLRNALYDEEDMFI